MTDLSIIVVNYNSANWIHDCLQSLYEKTSGISLEVIVVDNASRDDDKNSLLTSYPQIHWIDMGYNAGFARANNAGMKVAKGEMVLLLNPDTLVFDNSIAICCQRLRAGEWIGAGVQLQNADRSPQISGHYFVRGGINLLLPLPYWGAFLRWLGYSFKTKLPNIPQVSGTQDVDWVSGAFLMVKKQVLEKSGLMDEDFFLYAEEVEWCSRLRKCGRLCIFGDLGIIHLQGEAINKDQESTEKGYYGLYDRKALQLMVSNHLRVRKQYGAGWFMFLLLNYSWGVFFFAVAGFIDNLFHLKNPFAHFGKVLAFGKNMAILWSLSPRIISNRPHFYKLL